MPQENVAENYEHQPDIQGKPDGTCGDQHIESPNFGVEDDAADKTDGKGQREERVRLGKYVHYLFQEDIRCYEETMRALPSLLCYGASRKTGHKNTRFF